MKITVLKPPGRERHRRYSIALGGLTLSIFVFACGEQRASNDSAATALLSLFGQSGFQTGMYGVQSEDTRADLNEERVSCYATIADKAYDAINTLTSTCATSTVSKDTRNGMGQWTLQSQQSTANGDIIKFWERTSGNRKEIAIGMRGSVTAGDWYRDAQSQFWVSRAPQDNAISNMGSAPSIDMVGDNPKFDAGFDTRVNNLAPEIAQKLQELETWRSQAAGREIGVKVSGHSLGAATATIAGLYIADRYNGDNNADVEVFAYNSPKPMSEDMSDTYRKAATSCNFNVHVFNNSRDVVSAVPTGAHHVFDEADNGPLQFGREACAYKGHFRQSTGLSGMHLPSALNPLAMAAQATGNYVLSRHDRNQWILSEPVSRLQHAPKQIAASWFPIDDMGGSLTNVTLPPGRTPVVGIFDANLYNTTHGKYMRAVPNGTRDVRFDRTVAGIDERFRFTPGDSDCVRHGGTVTLRPVANYGYYVNAIGGALNSQTWLFALRWNSFTVVNHTNILGCIAQNDIISLRTWDGQYVVAEDNGDGNANRPHMLSWEKFTVRNIQNITPIPQPGDEGWNRMAGLLKQISVGYGGEIWGVNSSDNIYRYNNNDSWTQISGALKNVSVGQNGVVWGTNAANNVYRYNGNNTWTQIPAPSGGMKQVSVGHDGTVWGVQPDNDLYRYNTNNTWTLLNGKRKYVSVRTEEDVWSIDPNNNVYRADGQFWYSVPGPAGGLTQISVGMGGEVWAVAPDEKVYRYDDPGWTLIPGGARKKHISVGFYEEVWGVNSADQVWRLKNF